MALSCRQAVSFGKKYFFSLPRHLLRPSSSSSVFSVDDEVVYPYIRPKYPPGDWGEITPDKAWQLREMRDTLMSKQTAKRRLEELAELGQVAWIIKSLDARPGTLLFKQYLTKTHVETGLPERYLEMDDSLVDQLVGRVKSQVEDVILLEKEHWLKTNSSSARVHPKDEQAYCRQRLVKQIMDVLINSASYDVPHLLEAQMDTDANVQSFWRRINCGDPDEHYTFGRDGDKEGRLWFQGVHQADLQIRTELPLPEFLPMDDEKCMGTVMEKYKYSPAVYGYGYKRQKLFSISGHWQEDPCQFTLLAVNVTNNKFDKFIQDFGERFYHEASANCGMFSAFLSCAAQAHNQGFNWLMDPTYPFTTQVIVTDGLRFQFLAYQLNTLRLWVNDKDHVRRNVCWKTDALNLYETIENNQVKGLNEGVLKWLMKFLVMAPQERGIDLRPYLPSEKRHEKFINLKGEEPIPFEQPGRFDYPRNSTYFQQNF